MDVAGKRRLVVVGLEGGSGVLRGGLVGFDAEHAKVCVGDAELIVQEGGVEIGEVILCECFVLCGATDVLATVSRDDEACEGGLSFDEAGVACGDASTGFECFVGIAKEIACFSVVEVVEESSHDDEVEGAFERFVGDELGDGLAVKFSCGTPAFLGCGDIFGAEVDADILDLLVEIGEEIAGPTAHVQDAFMCAQMCAIS